MLAAATDDVELVVVAGARMRDEQLPIADAAHPHRMPPRIPEIEIADHADAPRVRRQHHEGDAVDALERHRMRAELVVDALVGALAEQIEVELAQYRREAVGIVELDHIVAEAGAQLIAFRAVRQRAGKQTSIVDPRQGCRFAMLADGFHVGRLGQEGAYDALLSLGVETEIVEGVGVPALDDRIGFGGQFGHAASCGCCPSIRSIPVSGTLSQSGRCASSYSIS